MKQHHFTPYLPENSTVWKEIHDMVAKKSLEECLTTLLCWNSSYSGNLKPLIIGKYAKPRNFKNISLLSCMNINNTKTWIILNIQKHGLYKHIYQFIKGFSARTGVAEKKVLLFVDKCVSHPKHIMFKRHEDHFPSPLLDQPAAAP
jgi:hypothetical protein